MKKMFVASIICALFLVACSPKVTQSTTANANANAEGEAIKVSGACNMCKKRIETAVYGLSGIKTATWSASSQSLMVSYDAKKTSNEAIQKRIAAIGHDTEKFKAEEKTYNGLPPCCHYREVSAH